MFYNAREVKSRKMEIKKVQEEIVEEFSVFDDWMERYNLLIDMGKSLPLIDPKYKTNEFLIEGCQSKVWLYPQFDGEKIKFTADSDAIITKGIVSLLIRFYQTEHQMRFWKPTSVLSMRSDSGRTCPLPGQTGFYQ